MDEGGVSEPFARERVDVHLHVPTSTILKLLLTALVVAAALRLWPELVFLSLSVLFAVALEPVVAWMVRRNLPRGLSVMLIAIATLGIISLAIAFVLPPLVDQLGSLAANLSVLQARIERAIDPRDTMLRTVVEQVFSLPSSPTLMAELNKPLLWGRAAVSGVLTTCFVLVTTLYLLIDGKSLYAWLLAYVPRRHRDKMAETMTEVSKVVYAFVRGQMITSALFTVLTAIVLAALGVPAVVPLALLAGACGVIPVAGIIIATVPATLLALTVSPLTAVMVVGYYVIYHLFEAYFIVPRVYGSSLRLSTLAVILALVVGGVLQGILGAILVLPIVAAYPTIERIWLKRYLGREVIADHTALARAAATGDRDAVDAVLQGEVHPGERLSIDPMRGSVV
jgi:predicted PurR-regulated permease PerM